MANAATDPPAPARDDDDHRPTGGEGHDTDDDHDTDGDDASDDVTDPGAARATPLRAMMLGALVLSAAAVFFVQPRVVTAVRGGALDAVWLAAAPALFSLVVVVAAIDAWRKARRQGYFSGPRVVAIAACVAFLGLLLPNAVSEYRARTSPPSDSAAYLEVLLKSRDPRVRALVVEVAGLKSDLDEAPDLLAAGLADPDPLVVRTALAAVERRAGAPLVGPDAPARAREIVKTWQTTR